MVLLDGWSGPTKTSRSTSKNFRFQSYFAKQQSKFRPKRKWIVSMWLTLFQLNNAVPFSLDDSTNHDCLVWQMETFIASVAAAPRTHRLDYWYSSSSLRIAHVRYIKILTWLRGFLVIFLYLVRFGFLCARVSSGNCETMESWKFGTLTLRPRSHVRILKYRKWAISGQKLLCTNSQTLYTAVSYFLINQSKL